MTSKVVSIAPCSDKEVIEKNVEEKKKETGKKIDYKRAANKKKKKLKSSRASCHIVGYTKKYPRKKIGQFCVLFIHKSNARNQVYHRKRLIHCLAK